VRIDPGQPSLARSAVLTLPRLVDEMNKSRCHLYGAAPNEDHVELAKGSDIDFKESEMISDVGEKNESQSGHEWTSKYCPRPTIRRGVKLSQAILTNTTCFGFY